MNRVGIRFDSQQDYYTAIALYQKLYPHGYIRDEKAINIITIPKSLSHSLYNSLRHNGVSYYQFSTPPDNQPVCFPNDVVTHAVFDMRRYESELLQSFRAAASDASETGQESTREALSLVVRGDKGRLFARRALGEFINLIAQDPARQTEANAVCFLKLMREPDFPTGFRLDAVDGLFRIAQTVADRRRIGSVDEMNTASIRRELSCIAEDKQNPLDLRDAAAGLFRDMRNSAAQPSAKASIYSKELVA